jgi:hypothetical protein
MTHPRFDVAFSNARTVISTERARQIVRLKNWEHGMCGCLNATNPDVPPLSENENRLIQELWNAISGSSSWMTALFLLVSEP